MRDLGLVKGGKGMRHHEVVVGLSLRDLLDGLHGSLRNIAQTLRTRTAAARQEVAGAVPVETIAELNRRRR